jgi:hypothetical protein
MSVSYVIALLMVILIALMYWSLRVYIGMQTQRIEEAITRLEERLQGKRDE